MLRQIIEKTYEFNVDIHQLFIDYKQAYDSINQQQMYTIMKEFGIPEKLINLVKMTLRRLLNKGQISGKLSWQFGNNMWPQTRGCTFYLVV
jgi:hypothetical protein